MKQGFRVVSAALAVAALSACATINANGDKAAAVAATSASAMPSPVAPTPAVSGGAARPAGAGAAPAAAANAAAAAPGSPRPFADVIKDAKRTDGLFPLWQKDDKTWIEIPESLLNTPFFLSVNMSRGIGERFLFAGLMGNSWFGAGGEYVAEFRKAARQHPAARAQHDLHREGGQSRRARGEEVVLGQPARFGARGEPAASGAQVRADRRQCAAHDRHPARVEPDRADVPQLVPVRRPQLVHPVGEVECRPHGHRRDGALRPAADPGPGADAARRAARPLLPAAGRA